MSHHDASRRRFLRAASIVSGSVGAAATPFALNLATLGSAAAQSASNYKAIVCLFLYGGNDSSNMVFRTDAASFDEYTRLRSVAPDPIALKAPGTPPDANAQLASPARLGGVIPIAPRFTVFPQNSANTFALHPSMSEARDLFAANRLAVIANAGPLIQPLTKTEYDAKTKPRPKSLGSHNDQQSTWQALSAEGARIGWGGRLGDMVASSNSNTVFTGISVSGNAVFLSGDEGFQYQIGNSGAVQIGGLTGRLFGSAAAGAALRSIVTADHQHLFAKEHSTIVKRSIDTQATFQSAFTASTAATPTQYLQPSTGALATNDLAVKLQTVARVIGARGGLGMGRQVFFVSMNGFDTHDRQNSRQADLLARLSHALGYFDSALANLGGTDMRDQVTLFTASEFGRNFTSNGDGTDHGWGGHHFISGGAVKGGEIFGSFPQFGFDLPDSARDKFLPSVSVDQIGGALGRWFGVSDTNLDLVFPNLRNFDRNLGFMKST